MHRFIYSVKVQGAGVYTPVNRQTTDPIFPHPHGREYLISSRIFADMVIQEKLSPKWTPSDRNFGVYHKFGRNLGKLGKNAIRQIFPMQGKFIWGQELFSSQLPRKAVFFPHPRGQRDLARIYAGDVYNCDMPEEKLPITDTHHPEELLFIDIQLSCKKFISGGSLRRTEISFIP